MSRKTFQDIKIGDKLYHLDFLNDKIDEGLVTNIVFTEYEHRIDYCTGKEYDTKIDRTTIYFSIETEPDINTVTYGPSYLKNERYKYCLQNVYVHKNDAIDDLKEIYLKQIKYNEKEIEKLVENNKVLNQKMETLLGSYSSD